MIRIAKHLALIALLAFLSGCYSMTRVRMLQGVTTDGDAATLEVWVDSPGPVLSDPPVLAYDVIVPVVLYPLDKLSSLLIAIKAPFDPATDIRWGPIGALAGITLPWVTLIPDLYGPLPLRDVVLDRVDFDRLMTRVRQGGGVRAYIDIVKDCRWRGGQSALHSVRVYDGPPSKTARHGAATDGRPQAGDRR